MRILTLLLALSILVPNVTQAQIWTQEDANRATTGQPDYDASLKKLEDKQRQLEEKLWDLELEQDQARHRQIEIDSFRREHQNDPPANFPW
jgi:hypothetical protein